jgi:hypothetical protein
MSNVHEAFQRKWLWVLTGTLAGAGLGGVLTSTSRSGSAESDARWRLLRERHRRRQGSRPMILAGTMPSNR